MIRTNFTVTLWVRTTNTGTGSTWYNGMGLVDGETVGGAADWGCSVLNSKFAVGMGLPDTTVYSTVNVNDGAWHRLAFTRHSDSGAVRLYVDGALNFAATLSVGPRTAPNDLRIGATHAPAPVILRGNLDDVRMYDEALAAADIAALANPPPPVIQSIALAGGNVMLRGTGGNPNAQYLLLSSTNLTLSPPRWTASTPGDFDGGGKCSATNTFNLSTPAKFFRLQLF